MSRQHQLRQRRVGGDRCAVRAVRVARRPACPCAHSAMPRAKCQMPRRIRQRRRRLGLREDRVPLPEAHLREQRRDHELLHEAQRLQLRAGRRAARSARAASSASVREPCRRRGHRREVPVVRHVAERIDAVAAAADGEERLVGGAGGEVGRAWRRGSGRCGCRCAPACARGGRSPARARRAVGIAARRAAVSARPRRHGCSSASRRCGCGLRCSTRSSVADDLRRCTAVGLPSGVQYAHGDRSISASAYSAATSSSSGIARATVGHRVGIGRSSGLRSAGAGSA